MYVCLVVPFRILAKRQTVRDNHQIDGRPEVGPLRPAGTSKLERQLYRPFRRQGTGNRAHIVVQLRTQVSVSSRCTTSKNINTRSLNCTWRVFHVLNTIGNETAFCPTPIFPSSRRNKVLHPQIHPKTIYYTETRPPSHVKGGSLSVTITSRDKLIFRRGDTIDYCSGR